MNIMINILAQDDDGFDFVHLIVFLVIVAISIISSIVQKAKEKTKQQQGGPKPQPSGQGGVSMPQEDVAKLREALQQKAAAKQKAAQAKQLKALGVQEEMRLEKARLAKQEAQRRQRLASRRPPEEDSEDIQRRIVHVKSKIGQSREVREKKAKGYYGSLLGNKETARKAIVLREILSPPKAMRKGDEIWDL